MQSGEKGGGRTPPERKKTQNKAHLRFDDLEVAHLDPARGEIGYLEFDADRALALASSAQAGDPAHAAPEAARHAASVLVVAFDRGEAQLGAHEELLAAAELLDLPDDGAFLWRVVHAADVGAEARRVGVFGDGDEDLDVVGRGAAFELGAGLFCCWSVIRWL